MRACFVFGMVTVLMSCKEGQSVFPIFAALEVRPDCVAWWNLRYWFAKFWYVGGVQNFGKQSCE